MITDLELRDLGVVADATLPLHERLTVLTGETGAGKTMIVTALQLLQGQRADSLKVRVGAEHAEVVGHLQISPDGPTAAQVAEAGGEIDDELLVARRVSASGRSRAWVGGRSVPTGVLGRVVAPLVSIHGQSDQLRLRTAADQRGLLDAFGGASVTQARAEFDQAYIRWRSLQRRLDELIERAAERAVEAETLREQIAAIEDVAPEPGEQQQLSDRARVLDARQDLARAAEAARARLSTDEFAAIAPTDALAQLVDAARELQGIDNPDLQASASRLEELQIGVQEVTADLSRFLASLDEIGEGEVEAVHERLAALRELERRFGSVDAAIDLLDSGSARLLELDNDDATRDQLRLDAESAARDVESTAAALTALRTDAARTLAEGVTGELRALAMGQTEFRVSVSPQPVDASGADEVAFLLAAHRGAPALPLARSASGGELSRVMLALELQVADTGPDEARLTFVFDEVDAGVGGAAAVQIGRRLAALARHAQVLVVTHLPQVAAFADLHLRVTKVADDAAVTSQVEPLDDAGRIAEIARMLAGEVSDTALAHARELVERSRRAATHSDET